MNTPLIKVVHCNAITYVYNYTYNKNISSFSFEDEFVQLKRLLATNFINDYVTTSFKLTITTDNLDSLHSRLQSFLEHFAKRGLKYIAVLDLTSEAPALHLVTNKFPSLSDEQLSTLWGDKVTVDYIDYETLLPFYYEIAKASSSLTSEYIFVSDKLKKPRTFHNDKAEDFLYTNDIFDAYEYEEYEVFDEQCGTIIVNKYIEPNQH